MSGYISRRGYRKKDIRKYEIEVLMSGNCKAFLVPGVEYHGDEVYLTVSYEGYIRGTRMVFRDVIQPLNLILKVIDDIRDAEDHLISSSRTVLEPGLVYYCPKDDDIKLEFCPAADGMTADRRIIGLLESIRRSYREKDAFYIDDVIRYIKGNNPGLKDIKRYIMNVKGNILSYRSGQTT